MTITATLPGRTPSLNETLRMHWAVRKKAKLRWAETFVAVFPQQVRWAKEKRAVWLRMHRSRMLDHDNAVGGAKDFMDAMKIAGLIKDDKPEWLDGPFVAQAKCPKGQERIEVEISYEA